MNESKVFIRIGSKDVEPSLIYSDKDEIRVIKIEDNAYYIAYKYQTFNSMDIDAFSVSLYNLLRNNIINSKIMIAICPLTGFVNSINVEKIIQKIQSYPEPFEYIDPSNIEHNEYSDDDEIDYEDIFDDYDDEDYEYDIDPFGFMKHLGEFSLDDEDYEYDDEDDYQYRESSYVLREADKAKRSYQRHGLVICNNKRAIRNDKRIIKDFLKDFIPGNATWIKDFRDDIIERWMSMYMISKKSLKHLQKSQNRKSEYDQNKLRRSKAMNLTKKILGVYEDRWSDPNR